MCIVIKRALEKKKSTDYLVDTMSCVAQYQVLVEPLSGCGFLDSTFQLILTKVTERKMNSIAKSLKISLYWAVKNIATIKWVTNGLTRTSSIVKMGCYLV